MTATVLAALLFSASAQIPTPDAIARQLNSRDAQTVAWGAYNTGAYHRVELVPRLQQILEALPSTSPLEERALLDVVMDALIQLNAHVPAALVVPHLRQRPVQTLILLARAPDREGVLLDLLPQLSGLRWFAAANILFDDRSTGLVAHLAQTVKLQLTVHVTDSSTLGYGASGGLMASVACGIGQDPPGFPPHAEYRFGSGAQPGLTVLANGPHPVYYSRTVTTAVQYGVSQPESGGPTDEDRVDYLRAMAPPTGGIPFRAHSIETVRWSTIEAYSQRVQELRAQVAQRFQYLVDRARASRSMTGELRVHPPIELTIVDHRRNQAVALPKPDGRH